MLLPSSTSSLPSSTAIHEAGHAVAILSTDRYLGKVTIVPDQEERTLGHIGEKESLVRNSHSREKALALWREELRITLAGYAAVLVFRGDEAQARQGCTPDFEAAERICQVSGLSLAQAKADTVAFLNEMWTWGAVLRVAEELDFLQTIDPDEADILAEIGKGKIPETGITEYRRQFKRQRYPPLLP